MDPEKKKRTNPTRMMRYVRVREGADAALGFIVRGAIGEGGRGEEEGSEEGWVKSKGAEASERGGEDER